MNPSACARLALGVLAVLVVLPPQFAAASDDAPSACAAVANHDYSGSVGASVTVGKAKYVPPGALPAYCEVSAVISPAVRVAMRLPATGWTHRLLVVGCGGLCGVLQIEAADDALARGYATATTDMGHDNAAGIGWRQDPAALEDFAHRATHVTTVLAKAVVQAYYGASQNHSYFRGCSTGGRQGLMEALRYPADFDGIIAGAPATYPTVQIQLWDRQVNRDANGADILDTRALALLHDAALAACDRLDGIADGLISNPLGCGFDPAGLQCSAGSKTRCLTAEQVSVARKFYAGPVAHGQRLTTLGMAPGSELGVAANIASVGGKPPLADSVLENFAHLSIGPQATWQDIRFDGNIGRESSTDGIAEADAEPNALGSFVARRGKLLMYGGWIDPLVSPTVAVDFYRKHAAALGAQAGESLRLFMMPGMGHCRGGNGPDTVDWLSSIEAWVERGTAPPSLLSYQLAGRTGGETPARFPLPPDRVLAARPLYPFPSYAKYRGSGPVTDPASFEPGAQP
jgi:feruloyl esterase